MKRSRLKDVFKTVAAKYLSAVDAEPQKSNQHEFGGLSALKSLWGELPDPKNILAHFIYFSDNFESPISIEGSITWYDARKNNAERSPEWRIYYTSNQVTEQMKEGDLLIVSETSAGKTLIAIAEKDSTYASQLLSLFGIKQIKKKGFTIRSIDITDELDLPSRFILDTMQVQYDFYDDNYLDLIIRKFGYTFPSSEEFSRFSRSTIANEQILESVDDLLIQWMEREELLFRTLENHIVLQKVSSGFSDVESFVKYSLSVLNRRKARVGLAFENHLEEVFRLKKIHFSRGAITESRIKPDFLFPSGRAYHDPQFNQELLTMLGVKSTCKDRWRQVLSEAKRIPRKHLITLEPAISDQQLSEMQSSQLQLVIPHCLHSTYSPSQQASIWTLSEFIDYVDVTERKAKNEYPKTFSTIWTT